MTVCAGICVNVCAAVFMESKCIAICPVGGLASYWDALDAHAYAMHIVRYIRVYRVRILGFVAIYRNFKQFSYHCELAMESVRNLLASARRIWIS